MERRRERCRLHHAFLATEAATQDRVHLLCLRGLWTCQIVCFAVAWHDRHKTQSPYKHCLRDRSCMTPMQAGRMLSIEGWTCQLDPISLSPHRFPCFKHPSPIIEGKVFRYFVLREPSELLNVVIRL